MQVSFYTFTKRPNSTKIVDATADWAPEVNLKKPTSFYSPILLLGVQTGANVTRHNYCKIDNVCGVASAYYYINDWISVRNDLYEIHCTMDLLATYKEYIGQTVAYIDYSASAGNGNLPDQRNARTYAPTVTMGIANLPFTYVSDNLVLSVVGEDGSIGSYNLYRNALRNLLNNVSEWTSGIFQGSYEDSFSGVIKMLKDCMSQYLSSKNAPDCIRGCISVPWVTSNRVSKTIYLGGYDTGVTGALITDPYLSGSVTINLSNTGTWEDTSLCKSYNLYLPHAGNFDLPADLLAGATAITISIVIQTDNGDISYVVHRGQTAAGVPILTAGANCGVEVPIGSVTTGKISDITRLFSVSAQYTAQAIDHLIAGGNVTYEPVNIGVIDPGNIIPGRISTCGGIGNGAGAQMPENRRITLTRYYYAPVSDMSALGLPTKTTMTINTLSGYVKTIGARVAAPTGKSQLDKINSMLDGGFYYE